MNSIYPESEWHDDSINNLYTVTCGRERNLDKFWQIILNINGQNNNQYYVWVDKGSGIRSNET